MGWFLYDKGLRHERVNVYITENFTEFRKPVLVGFFLFLPVM